MRKEQTDEEEPFYRGADNRDDQGTGGPASHGRGTPLARSEHDDVLQAEGQIRRLGSV